MNLPNKIRLFPGHVPSALGSRSLGTLIAHCALITMILAENTLLHQVGTKLKMKRYPIVENGAISYSLEI